MLEILPKNIRIRIKQFILKLRRIFRKDIDYIYDEEFAKLSIRNKPWTDDFHSLVMKTFNPKSIIDFGCGTGDILAPFEKRGIDILGIDGSRVLKKHSKIKEENFLLLDLRNLYKSKKKYDLCFCFELAEHMEEKYSDILVESLIYSSPSTVFTAAIPGQAGKGHVNLKPLEWWAEKFQRRGCNLEEGLTDNLKKAMKNIPGVQWWYINNLMVFKKR